jgi:hypothetical protein
MRKMSLLAGSLLVLAGLGTVPALQAAEQVTLKNGYNLLCDHRQQEGDRVRLFTSKDGGNFVEVDAAEIASVDTVPDPPVVPTQAAEPRLASVVRAESGGNIHAVSRTGAQGLMQLMPGTAAELGVTDSFRADQNINGGTAYLDALLLRYHDHLALALAAYNAGPAAVDKYHGVPPYRETRLYVARVIREFNRRKQWEKLHPSATAALSSMPANR